MTRPPICYATPLGEVTVTLSVGTFTLPVFAGILKHPTRAELFEILLRPNVARKYLNEILRSAPWPILKAFPRELLVSYLPLCRLSSGRERALKFLLGSESSNRLIA